MKLHIQLQADGTTAAAQQFEIPIAGDDVVIGRGPDSPVPLEGSKLSRNHIAFGINNGVLTLTDLSSNGVWVNAQSVPKKSAVALNGSEEIAIPGYRMRVRLLIPPPPQSSPAAAPETSTPAAKPAATAPSATVSAAPVPATPAPPTATSASDENARRTTAELRPELASFSSQTSEESEASTEKDPPWWALSSAERMVLFFIALSIALLAYYYLLQ